MAEQQMATARGARRPRPTADNWGERYGFALLTLVLAIPLSAIAAALTGFAGMLVTWIGIVGVNVAQAIRLNPDLLPGRGRSGGADD